MEKYVLLKILPPCLASLLADGEKGKQWEKPATNY